jgi:hypothetical protein
MLIPK